MHDAPIFPQITVSLIWVGYILLQYKFLDSRSIGTPLMLAKLANVQQLTTQAIKA